MNITAGISHIRRPGTTSPLVLLHGIGSDAESWARMIEVMDPSIDVTAWNAPGYGDSEPLTNPLPTPEDYATRLAEFLDALGMKRVTLAGHSLGTLFAARFALRYPERVSRLALLSPALGYAVPPGEVLPSNVQSRVDDLQRLGATEFATTRAPKLVFRPEANSDIVAGVRRAMSAIKMPGYGQAVRALGAGTLLTDASRITIPTLVACGTQDIVTPPSNAQATYDAALTKHSLTLIPEAGHALPQQAPEAVARLLEGLVREATDV